MVIVGMLLAGCVSYYCRTRTDHALVVEVQREFEMYVQPASQEFAKDVAIAAKRTEDELADGFLAIREQFAEECLNADGYIARAHNDQEKAQALSDFLRVAITEHLQRNVEGFYEGYYDQVDLLEKRLLVDTKLKTHFFNIEQQYNFKVKQYAPKASLNDLRGSGTYKVADEAFGWVPVFGDIYDAAKLIFGDPREAAIRERAKQYVIQQELYWKPLLDEFKASLPKATAVEATCRATFNANQAVARLERE